MTMMMMGEGQRRNVVALLTPVRVLRRAGRVPRTTGSDGK